MIGQWACASVTNLSHGTSWRLKIWLRGGDLNPRPLGYEPNELPDCSTPRHCVRTTNVTRRSGVVKGPRSEEYVTGRRRPGRRL